MMLDTTQYRASPLGKLRVKKPNMKGIIQSIMRLVDCCLGSAAGIVVIFCMSHIDPPTSIGRNSGIGFSWAVSARSSHRKVESRGIASLTLGSHE